MFQYQVENNTTLFRNQSLFENMRSLLQASTFPGGARPKILSFGCSTGQEAVTLKFYFPDCDIYACDINETVLEVAKRNFGHLGIHFFMSTEGSISENGPYDAIFAFSTLCQTTAPEAVELKFNFTAYCSTLEMFSDNLADNGYLVIYNSSYLFSDSTIAASFQSVRPGNIWENGFVPKFDKHDKWLFSMTRNTRHLLLTKQEPYQSIRSDYDLIDCIFRKKSNPDDPAFVSISIAMPEDTGELVEFAKFTEWNTDGYPEETNAMKIRFEYQVFRDESNNAGLMSRSVFKESIEDRNMFHAATEHLRFYI